jgi:hypothetical protein
VPDSFRTWRLRETQVQAEGDWPTGRFPLGSSRCVLPAGVWHFGSYGPAPRWDFGSNWWSVR